MIGHTSRNFNDYLKSIEIRNNGKYKRIPHYIISELGEVKELVNPKYTSEFKLFNCLSLYVDQKNLFLHFLSNTSPL